MLEHRNLTQVQLAATMKRLSEDDPKNIPKQSQAAAGQSAISNLITDSSRKPSAPTLLRMAAALQCSPAWLLFGEGDPFEINVISRKAEKDLLENFRNLDQQSQMALITAARAMARK